MFDVGDGIKALISTPPPSELGAKRCPNWWGLLYVT